MFAHRKIQRGDFTGTIVPFASRSYMGECAYEQGNTYRDGDVHGPYDDGDGGGDGYMDERAICGGVDRVGSERAVHKPEEAGGEEGCSAEGERGSAEGIGERVGVRLGDKSNDGEK